LKFLFEFSFEIIVGNDRDGKVGKAGFGKILMRKIIGK
jgi:hypothetical protein